MLLINEDKKFVINLIVRRCSKEVIAEILKMEFEDFKRLKLSEVINILNEKYNTFTGLEFEKIEKEVIAYNQKQAENYKGRDWVGIVFKDKV